MEAQGITIRGSSSEGDVRYVRIVVEVVVAVQVVLDTVEEILELRALMV